MPINEKYNQDCLVCLKNFKTNISNKKLCSKQCRLDFDNKRGRLVGVATASVGAISELEVSAYLLKNGYSVFRALSASCFCDLIAIKDNVSRKLEVRTGYKNLDGKISFPRTVNQTNGLPNEFAVYLAGENEIHFFPVTQEDIDKSKK